MKAHLELKLGRENRPLWACYKLLQHTKGIERFAPVYQLLLETLTDEEKDRLREIWRAK